MNDIIKNHRVVVFSTHMCSYCVRAKRLLQKNNIPFHEENITRSSDARKWLVETTKRWTVPQIFVDGKPIGGYQELELWVRNGKLDGLREEPAKLL